MKIYIKENTSFDLICYNGTLLKNQDYDFEIGDDFEEDSIDIILGDNGVGKTLFFQIFCLVGYIYHYHNRMRNEPDKYVNEIALSLDSLKIGSIKKEGDLTDTDKNGVFFETSARPRKDQGERNFIGLGVENADPGWVPLKYFFCIKIGPNAQEFFRTHNILYYSNSQFPNNQVFFSGNVISLRTTDVDKLFLLAMDSSIYERFGNAEIDISLNMTNPFVQVETELKSILSCEYMTSQAKTFMLQYSFNPEYKEKLRPINSLDSYYQGVNDSDSSKDPYVELQSAVEKCKVYEIVQKWVYGPEKDRIMIPCERIKSSDFTIIDYFYIRLLMSKNLWFYADTLIDGVKIEHLNSGKQYEIMLASIDHLIKGLNKSILFIDEPENSHHIKLQEDLVNLTPQSHHLVLLSHSPFMVRGFRKGDRKYSVSRFRRDVANNRKLLIDTDSVEYDGVEDISAEYFSYSPVIDRWNELNSSIDPKNFMSMDEFYKRLDEIKKRYEA